MLIPFGFLASAGGGGVPAYELISTTVLTGTQAEISFNLAGLSATYKHLQIRGVVKNSSTSSVSSFVHMRFNGDTAYPNYRSHYLRSTGSAVQSGDVGEASYMEVGSFIGSADAAWDNMFNPYLIDILNPFSTTTNTTLRTVSGEVNSAYPLYRVQLYSGLWRNTAALTSIQFGNYSSGQIFKAGTRLSLYGIKGA